MCHSRQILNERMITAMAVLILTLVVALFAAVATYARHDRFAGPRNQHLQLDELGARSDRTPVRL
jgi:uncharacterized MAPEG superfamily protein